MTDPDESAQTPDLPESRPTRPPAAELAGDALRGGLIGVAETIPGVSGGTVALVTGIYTRLIGAGKALTDVGSALLTRGDWRAALRRVDWWLLVSVGVGAAVTVFAIAGLMKSFVTDQPVAAKALFMGMIAASVAVPFLELAPGSLRTRAARLRAAALFAGGAALAFVLTSLPRSEIEDPALPLVFVAAAIAVCALVLPGVSGSFFLLVMGLYATTLGAVEDRDLLYLAVFAAGAVFGLVSFLRILEWALHRHHTTVMVAAAGLLLGSLRALWPWQDDDGAALAAGDDWPLAVGLFAVGAALVAAVALAQRRLAGRDAAAAARGRDGGRASREPVAP
ncbi:DUF368 domain-containing protein [Gordonia sp. VNK21]|uniref:DUF368 domain-containing protein n=1 Tax=Gordonia sp. VNK21 TaxID=3382483 RepID=UPI0038D432CD